MEWRRSPGADSLNGFRQRYDDASSIWARALGLPLEWITRGSGVRGLDPRGYLAGSSGIFLESIHFATGVEMPLWFGPVPLLVIFGFFVFQGAKAVDLANRVLMLGLFVTYTIMVMLLLPHVEAELLNHVSWKCLRVSSSIVATSYGFHIIIPTLATYLNRNVRNLLIVITVGSILPLIVYLLWEVVSLGNIPVEGTCGIKHGYRIGANGVWMLAGVLNETWVNIVAKCFASFAIITSFLGVSLSLRDFLADGFKIKKDLKGAYLSWFLLGIGVIIKDYKRL